MDKKNHFLRLLIAKCKTFLARLLLYTVVCLYIVISVLAAKVVNAWLSSDCVPFTLFNSNVTLSLVMSELLNI